MWKFKPRIAKVSFKNAVGEFTLFDLQTYYKATIIYKTAWFWQKDKHVNQQNMIKILELDSKIKKNQ